MYNLCAKVRNLENKIFLLDKIGTTDKNRQFHPFGISVCTNETEHDFAFVFDCVKSGLKDIFDSDYKPKVLQADAAPSITKGFKKAFGYSDTDFTRLNCWPHVQRNLEKKVKSIKCPVVRAQIWSDISSLQLAHSPENFKMATELFIKKLKQKKMPYVTTFIEYMDDHWIKINSNWYEGAAPGYPSSKS